MIYEKIRSNAKINLVLNITGKDTTLHKIESIIAFIDLHDVILIKRIKSKKHSILFNGKFSKNIKEDNTVLKLLNLLEEKKLLENKKFQIKIKKKIIIINKHQLNEVCSSIGSDVILGLNPANSILTSKNVIKRFKNCKKFYTLVVKPNFGCSTKNIYSLVRKFTKPKLNRPNKRMFNYDFLKKMDNSLEPIAFSKYTKLRTIKFFLENLTKPELVRMTGSGSAVVAYFHSKESCDSAKKQFNQKYNNYWCISSKTV